MSTTTEKNLGIDRTQDWGEQASSLARILGRMSISRQQVTTVRGIIYRIRLPQILRTTEDLLVHSPTGNSSKVEARTRIVNSRIHKDNLQVGRHSPKVSRIYRSLEDFWLQSNPKYSSKARDRFPITGITISQLINNTLMFHHQKPTPLPLFTIIIIRLIKKLLPQLINLQRLSLGKRDRFRLTNLQFTIGNRVLRVN